VPHHTSHIPYFLHLPQKIPAVHAPALPSPSPEPAPEQQPQQKKGALLFRPIKRAAAKKAAGGKGKTILEVDLPLNAGKVPPLAFDSLHDEDSSFGSRQVVPM
jgi:hypothetical protein